jgi:hypothetical protein
MNTVFIIPLFIIQTAFTVQVYKSNIPFNHLYSVRTLIPSVKFSAQYLSQKNSILMTREPIKNVVQNYLNAQWKEISNFCGY